MDTALDCGRVWGDIDPEGAQEGRYRLYARRHGLARPCFDDGEVGQDGHAGQCFTGACLRCLSFWPGRLASASPVRLRSVLTTQQDMPDLQV